MKYSDARNNMKTGDVLMVKNRGLVSVAIRAFTAESFNHVAMIIRNYSGVFVVEMREGIGWQMMPASQWFEVNKKAEIYWGKAPREIRGDYCVESYAMKQRGQRYSYWSLITVWLSQMFNRKTVADLVCSTFIQKCYVKCQYFLDDKSFDPGDWMKHVKDINLVTP